MCTRCCPQALQDLQGVLVPQHLQTNRTAQAALAGRHRVQLSATAAELLMRFLHSARLTLLLALVNEYLEVAVRVALHAKPCERHCSHAEDDARRPAQLPTAGFGQHQQCG